MSARPVWFASAIGMIVLAALAVGHCSCTYSPYSVAAPSFSGNSTDCKQTVVVATADAPMPRGKNVIWCGSFQLAWDNLKSVMGGALPGKAEAVARLNAGKMPSADLPPGGYYAAAGRFNADIVRKIKSDMAAQFPNVKPDLGPLDTPGLEDLAYAYLEAAVKFKHPYFDSKNGVEFVDSAGNKTRILTFGTLETGSFSSANDELAKQIQVLYTHGEHSYDMKEFAMDLDKNSNGNQLILACVEPKTTLAQTWADLRQKIAQWKPKGDEATFDSEERLDVPNLNYAINHRFADLESDAGGVVLRAFQSIKFRLDKSGAALVSESNIYTQAIHRHFAFTKPFLIVMKRRDSQNPYFLMWVDNAELLSK